MNSISTPFPPDPGPLPITPTPVIPPSIQKVLDDAAKLAPLQQAIIAARAASDDAVEAVNHAKDVAASRNTAATAIFNDAQASLARARINASDVAASCANDVGKKVDAASAAQTVETQAHLELAQMIDVLTGDLAAIAPGADVAVNNGSVLP